MFHLFLLCTKCVCNVSAVLQTYWISFHTRQTATGSDSRIADSFSLVYVPPHYFLIRLPVQSVRHKVSYWQRQLKRCLVESMRTMKTKISLRRCAGWSWISLFVSELYTVPWVCNWIADARPDRLLQIELKWQENRFRLMASCYSHKLIDCWLIVWSLTDA